MAIVGLDFWPRFGTAAPENEPAGVVLRGEYEWLVTGGEAEIKALLDAVVGLGVQVSTQSAILKFGNVVGSFDLGPLGVLRVQCGSETRTRSTSYSKISPPVRSRCVIVDASDRSPRPSRSNSSSARRRTAPTAPAWSPRVGTSQSDSYFSVAP